MAIGSPRELFLRELRVVLDAEHEFSRAQEKMRRQINDRHVKKVLTNHLRETQQQILNLAMVFDCMNEEPQRLPCKGAQGINKEFQEGIRDVEGQELLGTAFVIGVLLKGEAYEVTAYQELIHQAEGLGERQAVQLLRQNLEQELSMVKTVEQLMVEVGQELARHG